MAKHFLRYAWFVLAYNVAVVLWGALVRATGSGAGCGEHWPLCNGEVLPRTPQLATIIEFTHRLTSGLAGLLVIGLLWFALRSFPKRHLVRRFAVLSLILTISEGLIGAGLVLLGHVATNQSAWRGLSLTIHLINTLLLIGALAATAWLATQHKPESFRPPLTTRALMTGAVLLIIVGITGAIAALGDTLFASESITRGLEQDLSPSSHIFLRLRILHPFSALLAAGYLVWLCVRILQAGRESTRLRYLALSLLGITALQLAIGATNLILLAPVWIQIVHLLAADFLWITFILLCVEFYQLRTDSWRGRERSPAAPLTAA